MRNALPVYGSPHDPHVERVAAALQTHGIDTFFYSLDYTSKTHAYFGGASESVQQIELVNLDGEPRDLSEFTTPLWLRQKLNVQSIRNRDDQIDVFRFAERSNYFASLFLMKKLKGFNPPDASRRANRKLIQLAIARELGLDIPTTVISNSFEDISKFLRDLDGVAVIKPYSKSFVPEPLDHSETELSFMCREITLQEVEEGERQQFELAPSILQEKVAKDYELRVIAFGDKALWFRIDATNTTFGQTDWRLGFSELEYAEEAPDKETEQKLFAYLQSFGLNYGIFDLIKDTNGRYVFLECNVDGQWAWLEDTLNIHSITDLYAEKIMEMLS